MIPPALAALVFLAYLAGTWSSMASGGIVNRVGRRTSLLLGIGVMMAGLLLTLSAVLWVIILGMLIFTAGFFAAHAVASGWVPVLAPETGRRLPASTTWATTSAPRCSGGCWASPSCTLAGPPGGVRGGLAAGGRGGRLVPQAAAPATARHRT
ncbi:hypothetical protein [Arthrobacter sp. JCM 19049]|uniref:hypothetical protein n=1 Tax=Arthrobacter sp. JCM 19049 TaxID=1460643 RepID=UPI000AA3FA8F|nr:hypothetical protein [Arthrobacter sp. JCM 19049]